jgi:CheY-like chemotaxis protein
MTPKPHRVILLVEDSEDDIFLLNHAFKQTDIALTSLVARDGEDAIAYLQGEGKYADRAAYPIPSLMLLDLKMPRKDGFEVLRWMRLQPGLLALPVVVLTNSTLTNEVTLAQQLGARSVLVKPSGLKDMVQMAKTLATFWLALNKLPELPVPPSHSAPRTL